MEREEFSEQDRDSPDDMPHGHEGSDREGGQVGVGVGGLGGGEPGGSTTDQGRGYGAEGGSARQESLESEEMPHAHEGSDRPGPQVGVGVGGLGGQEWANRREQSGGQGDAQDDDDGEESSSAPGEDRSR